MQNPFLRVKVNFFLLLKKKEQKNLQDFSLIKKRKKSIIYIDSVTNSKIFH